jgi:hypothetical protein
MQRAIRRHHRERMIQKWYKLYTFCWNSSDVSDEDRMVWAKNTYGRGSISCGCCCCANPRRGGRGDSPLTMQERKAFQYDWKHEHGE